MDVHVCSDKGYLTKVICYKVIFTNLSVTNLYDVTNLSVTNCYKLSTKLPQTGTFEGVGTTIVKVLTMFTGEINFDMYFVPPTTDTPNPVSYPYSTYPLYIFFLFLCPIILMNLLVRFVNFLRLLFIYIVVDVCCCD